MSELSLSELEKLEKKLLLWIKNDRKYLGDYNDFYFSEGEYYFHISYTGLVKNATITKLNDLWDIQTKKPLNDKQKASIKATCDKIIKEEKRLREIEKEISTAILGDEFFEESKKNTNKPNIKYTDEMFKYTSKLLLDGIKDYVAYEKTLEKYEMDISKAESYGKRYKASLKN